MAKVKYTVLVKYNVYDSVEVVLDDDQNSNDALEIAEEISCDRPLNDDDAHIDYSEIVDVEYLD